MIRFLASLFLALWAGLAYAQSTEDDRDYLTGLIEDAVSTEDLTVRLINFQGALSSEATADAITLADPDGVWLRLDDLTIAWNRSALLSGRLEIDTLKAGRITLNRLPPKAPTEADTPVTPFALPELPVSIEIKDVSANEILLAEELLGEPIAARFSGTLSLGEGSADTEVTLERTDGTTGQLSLTAAYQQATRQLSVKFLAEEGADGIVAGLLDIPDRPALRLEVTGDAPLQDFTAKIALTTDTTDRITGTLGLFQPEGSPDQAFNLDLSGDLRPLIEPNFHSFFGAQTLLRAEGAVLESGGIDVTSLVIAADQVVLRGNGSVDAKGWPQRLELIGRLGSGNGAPVRLPFSTTDVGGMSLDLRYDIASGDRWTGSFDITNLTQDGVTIDTLTLTGSGTLIPGQDGRDRVFTATTDYAARGLVFDDAALSTAIGRDINGTIDLGRSQGQPLTINTLTLSGAGIEATGNAVIEGPSRRLVTRGQLALTAADFSRFAAVAGVDLSGAGEVNLVGSVRPLDGIVNIALNARTTALGFGIDQIDPLLVGETRLSLLAERVGDVTQVRRLQLDNAALSARGEGRATEETANADITARLNDLTEVAPGLTGSADLAADLEVDAEGSVTLDTTLETVMATATLRGTATPNSAGGYDVTPDVSVNASDLSPFASLLGQRLGGAADASLAGRYVTNTGTLDARFNLRTQNLRLGPPSLDPVLAGTGRITADLSLNAARKLRLDALDLSFPNLTAQGTVATSGTDTTANLTARLSDVGLLVSDYSGPLTAAFSARQDAAGWQFDGSADGPAGTTAQTNGRVSNDGVFGAAITGAAPLALANIYIAPRRLDGQANFDLRLDGPLTLRSLRGPVQISDARLSAPELRQAFEGINGTLTFAGGTLRTALIGQHAVGGSVEINGPVDMSAPYQAGLTARISEIVLRDPTLYRTTATGQISVVGPLAGGAAIRGAIDLGAVEVQVPSTGVSALGSLPEVTHLGPRLDVQRTLARAGVTAQTQSNGATAGPDYPLDITLRAPSRIFVRGRGLDAELGGQLRLTGSTNAVVPIGQFGLVRGRLNILGQRFDLTEGFAQLQGDFTPYLRLIASSDTATGTRINIIVEGEADAVDVRFESVPELPQDEVLAQLLFGRDLRSISPLQAVQLASAAATLAGTGNGGVIQSLREGLDLDDLDIITDDVGNAAVRAGKYVSENVYTDVVVGADGRSEINLNIDLNSNFTARGSVASDGETSVGIFFERDY